MSNPRVKKSVRLRDVADSLNLSTSTVSRALAGSLVINEATREAIQHAAVEMGYLAPRLGPRRRRSASRTVGVLVSVNELHNRTMTMLIEHIHHDLLEFGYHMMVLIDPMNSATDTSHLSTFRPLIDGYLDGMILGSATRDSTIVRELQRLGVPMVLVVRSVEGMQVDIIEADNAHGGAEIMRHFHELGHRRIGLVMGPENASTSRDRARGAMDYLRGVGLTDEAMPVMWNAFTSDAGYSCAVQMLSEHNPVTAIMAGSDSIALGVLEAARVKGVDVPSRLSVAGFDDVPLSGSQLISLTTIHNPIKEMARTACRRMVERIRAFAQADSHHPRVMSCQPAWCVAILQRPLFGLLAAILQQKNPSSRHQHQNDLALESTSHNRLTTQVV